MDITIIGAGAWGTAVGLSSFRAGNNITLITKSLQDAEEINTHHENLTFFSGVKLPEAIRATHEYGSLSSGDAIFLICPSAAIDDICTHVKAQNLPESTPIFSFCKGLPGSIWELPSMYIQRHFPQNPFGVLSGPSFAREVASGLPTKLVLASDGNRRPNIPISFQNMALEYANDVIGVELGGCLKNVYAIGAGLFDGLQLGDNAKCSYITTCFNEMVQIGRLLGAKETTFSGPSGLGDLLLTCNGILSRNRTFGETIAKHKDPESIINSSVAAIEGYRSTKTFYNIFKEKAISAPIIEGLYRILYEEKPSIDRIKDILLGITFHQALQENEMS